MANYIADKAHQDPTAEFSLNEMALSALGGAISGGVMGGGAAFINTGVQNLGKNNQGQQQAAVISQKTQQQPSQIQEETASVEIPLQEKPSLKGKFAGLTRQGILGEYLNGLQGITASNAALALDSKFNDSFTKAQFTENNANGEFVKEGKGYFVLKDGKKTKITKTMFEYGQYLQSKNSEVSKNTFAEAPQIDNTNVSLSDDLIRYANNASLFDMGDTVNRTYQKNIDTIDGLNISDSEKAQAKAQIYELAQQELKARAGAVNPYTAGVAREVSGAKTSLEKAVNLAAQQTAIVEDLKRKSKSNNLKNEKQKFSDIIIEADKKGFNEVTIDGTTYYKAVKNWSTKKPKNFKSNPYVVNNTIAETAQQENVTAREQEQTAVNQSIPKVDNAQALIKAAKSKKVLKNGDTVYTVPVNVGRFHLYDTTVTVKKDGTIINNYDKDYEAYQAKKEQEQTEAENKKTAYNIAMTERGYADDGTVIYKTMPEGWKETQGGAYAPNGFVAINNNKSYRSGERQSAYIPDKWLARAMQNNTIAETAKNSYDLVKDGENSEVLENSRRNESGKDNSSTLISSSNENIRRTSANSFERWVYTGRSGTVEVEDSRGNRISGQIAAKISGTAITENGKPLLLNHFSKDMNFDTFSKGDIGFHFGNTEQALQRKVDLKQDKGRFIKAYLKIENPIYLGSDIMSFRSLQTATKLYGLGIINNQEYTAVKQLAIKDG